MPGSADQDRQEIRLRDTVGGDPDGGFVMNPGDLIAGTLVPSIEQGIAPLGALVAGVLATVLDARITLLIAVIGGLATAFWFSRP